MVILIIVGLLFAALGAYAARRQLLLRRKGQRVTGTVTRVDRQWDPGGGPNNAGGYDYYPVLRFETLTGQQVETRSGVGSSSPGAEAGQPVRVLYDPANPDTAEVDTFSAQAAAVLVPVIFVVMGIGVAIAGIAVMIGS